MSVHGKSELTTSSGVYHPRHKAKNKQTSVMPTKIASAGLPTVASALSLSAMSAACSDDCFVVLVFMYDKSASCSNQQARARHRGVANQSRSITDGIGTNRPASCQSVPVQEKWPVYSIHNPHTLFLFCTMRNPDFCTMRSPDADSLGAPLHRARPWLPRRCRSGGSAL